MTSILSLVARAAEMTRAPRCARCDAPTALVSEEMIAGTPPVLESVFHCERCGVDAVRCLVASGVD